MSRFDNGGDQGIQLAGIGGVTPDLNGFHAPADITYVSDSQVDIDIDTSASAAFLRRRISGEVVGRLWI